QAASSAGSGGAPLFDDLIRPRQQRRRDGEAEGLGGLEVDDQLERCRLLNRKVRRLGPFQNPVHHVRGAPEDVSDERPVRNETPGFRVFALCTYRRQTPLLRLLGDLRSVCIEHRARWNKGRACALSAHACEGSVQVARSTPLVYLELHPKRSSGSLGG